VARKSRSDATHNIEADVHGRNGGFVAHCGTHEAADANALLIAAAPELLAVVLRLVEQHDTFGTWQQGDWRRVLEIGRALYDDARAAIAKAEGFDG
jgi:hypothetical protein